jgi:branched-chain amino acid transport system ATP-binding protein
LAGAGRPTVLIDGGRTLNTQPLLTAEGVTVRFGGLVALSEVNVAVDKGSITGLVGPNGAGKSTLFGVISGLVRAQQGRIQLSGRDITGASAAARARLGLARTFQHPELFGGLNVREHLVLAYRMRYSRSRIWTDLFDPRHLLRSDGEEQQRCDTLLDLLGITAFVDSPVLGLPLGVSRLVEVGRALALSPSILLLDEPLSGLDAVAADRLTNVLVSLVEAEGISLLLVEHDFSAVARMCRHVVVLDFGVVIAAGSPEEVRNDPAVQAAYLGDAATSVGSRSVDG